MDRNGFLSVIFLLLIVSDFSCAYSLWNLRKLVGVAPKENSTVTSGGPPLPSPVSNKESKANPADGGESGRPKGSKSDDPDNPSTVVDKKSSQEENGGNVTCKGSTNRCSIQGTLTGCIQPLETGSKDLVLLIQNEGESTVNITISTSPRKVINNHEIPKHKTKEIDVSETIGGSTSTEILLKAGNGECTLRLGDHPSEGDFLQRLPLYYKQLTPIYGAYLVFLVLLIIGGTWACCKYRKRKRLDGVPYQELEMGLPESASADNLEAAEGWDEGWDDDWDEDKAVKSPGGRHIGSISSSGLTARSANRDGWDNSWDD
ncbi:hypothetical protein Vadar_024904 [Vaccinium darrowii]|uniref:Uncharacterized protein n=1 Tax=Vaccinium darrowii TaxID=229202 RepID=A0ACB7XTB5_9ERIC|nr:hypothetical protein Vadar_024904 [Vaccinium darrowii]